MAHNWQNWKSRFLTSPCHNIYRVEAVGLSLFNCTFKNYDFCKYVEFGAISWKFDILLITAWSNLNLKILLLICGTYNCDYLLHTAFCLYLTDFQLIQISLPNFAFFTVKSPSITQRSVFKIFSRKCFQKEQKPVAFLSQNYRLKKSFNFNWKQFQVFKIAKFEFKVTVHYYCLWAKCTQLWPLKLAWLAVCVYSIQCISLVMICSQRAFIFVLHIMATWWHSM